MPYPALPTSVLRGRPAPARSTQIAPGFAAFIALMLWFGVSITAHSATPSAAFPSSITVDNTALQLNGSGVRYKAIFQVYAAGLYLPARAQSSQDIWSQAGPKRLQVTMLRDIDASELGKLFARGIEENMDHQAFSRIVPGVMRMSEIFTTHKSLRSGESFLIDWLPGTGMVITVNGVAQGEPFREPEFFRALMGIWLGVHPADYRLKNALLGQSSS